MASAPNFSGKSFAEIRAITAKRHPDAVASKKRLIESTPSLRGKVDPDTGVRIKVREQELFRKAKKSSGSSQEAIQKFAVSVARARKANLSPQASITGRASVVSKPSGPSGTITAVQRPGGLEGTAFDLRQQGFTLRAKEARGIITPEEQAKLVGVSALLTLADAGVAFNKLPKTTQEVIKAFKKDPKKFVLKDIPNAVLDEINSISYYARTSPDTLIGRVAGEYILLKGVGVGLKAFGRLGSKAISKINPKTISSLRVGEKIKIPVPGKKKPIEFKIVDKIPKEPIPKQIARGGGTVGTAISSQGDRLISLIKQKKVIRKPIPKEQDLSLSTRRLLKKFDEGKISRKELGRLDKAIQKEGQKGLLERSFFLDPTGKLRPSRLGLTGTEREANLLDLIVGDATIRQPKPQILVFQNLKVQKFPKSLQKIKNKLLKNKALTQAESQQLLEFQLKKSGKAKPLGFISGESEITLAPGEILKRVKKLGSVRIKGKNVPIIKTEVFKPKGEIKKLLTKYRNNKLTKKQIRKLDKQLQKKTGFNYGLSSSKVTRKKFIDIKKFGLSGLSKGKSPSRRLSKPAKPSKGSSRPGRSSKTSRPSRTSRTSSPRRTSRPGSRISRPSRSTSRGSPRRLSKSGVPKSPPRAGRKVFTPGAVRPLKLSRAPRKGARKGKVGYAVLEKRGNKFIRLRSKPLTRKDALDKLAFRLNNKISRTAKIVEVNNVRKFGRILKKEKGSFTRNRKSLREYQIRKGRRIRTPNTFIEKKGKPVINTLGEKRQLMLNRLAKARSVRMKNLKAKRKKR